MKLYIIYSEVKEMTAILKAKKNVVQYSYDDGSMIYNMDCIEFLKTIQSGTVDTVFADPPYNIGKADWDNFKNQDEYLSWSIEWIAEAARVLKETGTLYICGFTEILADVKKPAMQYFEKCKWLIWYYENKANLGHDWGRSHESILCLRKSKDYIFNIDDIRIPYNAHTLKYPTREQGKTSQFGSAEKIYSWSPNPLGAKPKDVISVPTTCNGMNEKTKHPTQKPEALLRRVLLASSNEGDLIVDPFSGSGTTAVVSHQLKRRFCVNDMNAEYNKWANERILKVPDKTVEEWIELDKKIENRRGKIK